MLHDVFGYSEFRGPQLDIIESLLAGRNALVLMPTGGGKSLCYQIPALLRDGTAVVISPLIALMRDQVEALRHNGVSAAFLNSTLSASDRRETERALAAGELDLVYIAPERLLNDYTLDLLDRCELALFAIDEAHCVSQWGHDFRPEYMKLDVLRERFPGVPRIALTATADERTRAEIEHQLLPDGADDYVSSFDRPNIRYRVGIKHNAKSQLLRFLRESHQGHSGIVYCMSRKRCESIADWLTEKGIEAIPYHAGLDGATRELHQNRFIREEGLVVVATVAFGMGIDKPDVRFVVHLDLPKSMEAYYQETGRAGRDGLPAEAWLIYGLQDVVRLRQLIMDSEADEQHKRQERVRLEALLGYCEEVDCRRKRLLAYFGENYPRDCGNCDNCRTPPDTWDATEAARMALSCVHRTGQRFGAAHVIDVLMGSESERIQRLRHHRLSTYGIGKEHSKQTWQSVMRQLLARGYLEADPEGHGGLRLSEVCRPLLRGEERLTVRKDIVGAAKGPKKRLAAVPEAASDPAGWEVLRARRREIAESEGVPPFVIFHDATLLAMLEHRPRTLAEMAELPGVGQYKLEKYGNDFLAAVSELEAPA
ncbi:MAG: DNA helicase RecQ [Gammaproteobacteria bacterium]|jgi:ATP-dependent DNA helicase RecQ